jgi:hypothetical protein
MDGIPSWHHRDDALGRATPRRNADTSDGPGLLPSGPACERVLQRGCVGQRRHRIDEPPELGTRYSGVAWIVDEEGHPSDAILIAIDEQCGAHTLDRTAACPLEEAARHVVLGTVAATKSERLDRRECRLDSTRSGFPRAAAGRKGDDQDASERVPHAEWTVRAVTS